MVVSFGVMIYTNFSWFFWFIWIKRALSWNTNKVNAISMENIRTHTVEEEFSDNMTIFGFFGIVVFKSKNYFVDWIRGVVQDFISDHHFIIMVLVIIFMFKENSLLDAYTFSLPCFVKNFKYFRDSLRGEINFSTIGFVVGSNAITRLRRLIICIRTKFRSRCITCWTAKA